MADGDTPKDKIRRSLFPKHKGKVKIPKLQVSENWYRKTPMTINGKLRQTIMDALPFDTDKALADKILRAIFDKIAEEVKAGGFVTIPGFGRFHRRLQPARWVASRIGMPGKPGAIYLGQRWAPARYKAYFKAGESLLKA